MFSKGLHEQLIAEISDPNSADNWFELGQLHYDSVQSNRHEYAHYCFKMVLKLQPNHQQANYMMGVMYELGLYVEKNKEIAKLHLARSCDDFVTDEEDIQMETSSTQSRQSQTELLNQQGFLAQRRHSEATTSPNAFSESGNETCQCVVQ